MGLKPELPKLDGVEYELNSSGRPIFALVTLDFPLTELSPPIEKLKFRRLKAKDGMAGEGIQDETEAGYAIFAELANVDVETIGAVDLEDLERISEAVVPLMGKSAVKMQAKMMAETNATPSDGET